MFQNSEISFSEKNSDFLVHCHKSESRYCNEIPKHKGGNSPLHVIRDGGLSLFGSHGKGLEAGCLIAIRRYESTYQSRT